MLPKLAVVEYRFTTPTLTLKNGNNQKTITDVHNYNVCRIQLYLIWFSSFLTLSEEFKFILFNSLALALTEPLSGNQGP